jgi:phosphoribosylformylglycinamidine synthase
MKFGVVVFPGAGRTDEMVRILGQVMQQQVEQIDYRVEHISGFSSRDCIVLPGGYAYGDYLRPGALARHTPVVEAIRTFADSGGYVMGIGNGFQILCEAGMLPGALLRNRGDKFHCATVHVRTITSNSPITASINPDEVLRLPVAHLYGRYYTDNASLQRLISQDQVLFKYSDEAGNTEAHHSPNGSLYNIAGICNEARNVFGMMPLPERAVSPAGGNTDGQALFESLVRTAKTDILNQ